MKHSSDTVDVIISQGKLRSIRRGYRTYRIQEVLDVWAAKTRWWTNEEERVYYELLTDHGVLMVYRSGLEWKLARVYD